MQTITDEIARYSPISLAQMEEVKLLKRYDTKYALKESQLLSLLHSLADHYRILEVDQQRIFDYQTLYFDTDDFHFYHHHHNKKFDRFKIRFRKYVNSGLCYFEIKQKNNKGKTIKNRKKEQDITAELSHKQKTYIDNKLPSVFNISATDIKPALWTIFKRITLVNKAYNERLTIDLNLHFRDNRTVTGNPDKALNNLAVMELKQPKRSMNSPFLDEIRKAPIKPTSFSKYCIGTAMLNTKVKTNRFKLKLITLNQMSNGV